MARILDLIQDEDIVGDSVSTRGDLVIPFWDSTITGKDAIGGLPMLEEVVPYPQEYLNNLEKYEDHEISAMVMRRYIPREDIADQDLLEMMKRAHNFGMPLEMLDLNTFVLRLDQGPTASFKDIAARALAELMEAYCAKHNKRIELIVATSGDTGVAIMNAFGGSKYISVTVVYPTEGVSEMQEKQMLDTMARFPNVQVQPIIGNFDNCQDQTILIQRIKNLGNNRQKIGYDDTEECRQIRDQMRRKLGRTLDSDEVLQEEINTIDDLLRPINPGSANSQNKWRLVPQEYQYNIGIRNALRAGYIKKGEKVTYVIPSANVGHLTAGIMAMEAGLSIKKIVAATNANNILANLINHGVIRHPGFMNTEAPSMDIGDPNNYERILAFVSRKTGYTGKIDFVGMKNAITALDTKITKQREKIKEIEALNSFTNPQETDRERNVLAQMLLETISIKDFGVTDEMMQYLQSIVHVEDVQSNEEMYAAMHFTKKTKNVVMEPHGITAKIATDRARFKGIIAKDDPVIMLETAHPDKFGDALKKAHIRVSKEQQHPKLEELKNKKLKHMNKPAALRKEDLVGVVRMYRGKVDEIQSVA